MEREFQIHRTEEDYALAEFWRWALAFLIGVAMGCIGFVVDWGIESLNNFKFYHTVNTIATRGAHQTWLARLCELGTWVSICGWGIHSWGVQCPHSSCELLQYLLGMWHPHAGGRVVPLSRHTLRPASLFE